MSDLNHLTGEQALRLRCIELALQDPHADTVATARAFEAFITAQPKSPREQILAALEAADVR